MSVHLKLRQNTIKSSKNYGKWIAMPQNQGDVTTADLARMINQGTTFTQGEVHGIIMALVEQMRDAMHEGHTVVLEGFGRFHLTVESVPVDDPDDFNIQLHVKRARCKFVEAGQRRFIDHKLARPLSDDVKYTMQPEYDVNEEGATFKRRGKMR